MAQESKNIPLVATPEGWLTADIDCFRFLTSSAPPRRGVYWRQFKIDATHRPPIVLWVAGIGLMVLGAIIEERVLVIVGMAIVGFWLRCFLNVSNVLRRSPLSAGVIRGFEPNPLMRTKAAATAQKDGGLTSRVYFPILLIEEAIKEYGAVEVQFLADPKSDANQVIAARAAPTGFVEGDAAPPDQPKPS